MSKHSRQSVLVLEDDESLVALFVKVLQSAGYDVRSAGTVPLANSIFASRDFDVVVCDLSFAGDKNILDFVSSLRARQPGILVLIVTGYTPDDLASNAQSMSLEVMEKPFAPLELVRRVSSLLASRAA